MKRGVIPNPVIERPIPFRLFTITQTLNNPFMDPAAKPAVTFAFLPFSSYRDKPKASVTTYETRMCKRLESGQWLPMGKAWAGTVRWEYIGGEVGGDYVEQRSS